MKQIKNVDKLERDLPLYDGTDRIIKFGEILEVKVIAKVQYMVNNGFFEDLGEVKADKTEEKKEKEEYIMPPTPRKKKGRRYNKNNKKKYGDDN